VIAVETESKITKSTATYVLALSLFCLAGALIYFSLKVSEVTQSLPAILDSVEQTSAKIEPVLEEVNEIRDLIPPILEEVKQTRLLVPPILEEVRKTRETIPPILEEVEQTRKQIPAIIEEVAATRKQIPAVLDEVAATREIIPSVLGEVEKTREALPAMLDKADKIVAGAGEVGKKASEDAVAGVFTGIIKAPFKIVGNMSKSIFGSLGEGVKGVSDDDRNIITKLSNELLVSGVVGDSRSWENPKNGNKETVTLVNTKVIDGRECKVLHVEVFSAKKQLINEDLTACMKDNSEWEVIE
jgi:uncharacterized protein YoxC